MQLALEIKADGAFGSGDTKPALIEYQTTEGLTADGICGNATWDSTDRVIYGL